MYAKIFESMYHGSLATEGPWEALVTFQQLLVLADRIGVVDMTPESISRITTVPLEIITKGIEALEQPDPRSRSTNDDGRRIRRLDPQRSWGWQIINHSKYRAIRSAEERRDYMREKMRERRDAPPAVIEEAAKRHKWWITNEGIKAKGAELGIAARTGESWSEYKARLFDHINEQAKKNG